MQKFAHALSRLHIDLQRSTSSFSSAESCLFDLACRVRNLGNNDNNLLTSAKLALATLAWTEETVAPRSRTRTCRKHHLSTTQHTILEGGFPKLYCSSFSAQLCYTMLYVTMCDLWKQVLQACSSLTPVMPRWLDSIGFVHICSVNVGVIKTQIVLQSESGTCLRVS